MSDGYNLLEGIRVLEIALATPNALGMHLADMGAEVLKIEEPPEGDYVRLIGDQLAGASLLHHRWNRGKKSVTLSLKTDEAAASSSSSSRSRMWSSMACAPAPSTASAWATRP